MADVFTIGNFLTLLMLVFLQAVLGFDNLLYISMESKRVVADRRQYVRRVGVSVAIVLRLVLLFVVLKAIDAFQEPIASLHIKGVFEGDLNIHALIVLLGGVFILYTAVKEIFHMIAPVDLENGGEKSMRTVGTSIFWIVIMNLVFSFDSILSAIALTKVFAVMATAIVISGAAMVWLSDHVSSFLERNRMYEVLGLFILMLVGVMLVSEGGHLARLSFFGHEIEPMAKATFYFVIVFLVIVDVVQGRYQKRLLREREIRDAPLVAAS